MFVMWCNVVDSNVESSGVGYLVHYRLLLLDELSARFMNHPCLYLVCNENRLVALLCKVVGRLVRGEKSNASLDQ